MNQFEKILNRTTENQKDDSQKLINDAKLLLSSNASEEVKTLKSIGLSWQIDESEYKTGEMKLMSDYGKSLEKTIVNRDDILKMCKKYRLYMRRASKYIGSIPPTLGAELTRFCKEKNIVLPASESYSNFYIIAPPKMFADYKSPASNLMKAYDETIEAKKQRKIRELANDPILIYKIDATHFAVIKSWGNDFSWIRRIYAVATKPLSMRIFTILSSFLICLLFLKLTIITVGWAFTTQENITFLNFIRGLFGFAVAAGCFSWVCLNIFSEDFLNFRKILRESVSKVDHIVM